MREEEKGGKRISWSESGTIDSPCSASHPSTTPGFLRGPLASSFLSSSSSSSLSLTQRSSFKYSSKAAFTTPSATSPACSPFSPLCNDDLDEVAEFGGGWTGGEAIRFIRKGRMVSDFENGGKALCPPTSRRRTNVHCFLRSMRGERRASFSPQWRLCLGVFIISVFFLDHPLSSQLYFSHLCAWFASLFTLETFR